MRIWIILSVVSVFSISTFTLPVPAIYDEESENDGKVDFVDEDTNDRKLDTFVHKSVYLILNEFQLPRLNVSVSDMAEEVDTMAGEGARIL